MNNIVSGMNIGNMTDKLLKPPLLEKIRNYLLKADSTKEIFLFAPYIKAKTLSKLVDGLDNITIVTTWHIRDLVGPRTSSDLDVYPLCKKNNYKLYVNNGIHLKVYSVGLESAIVTSGNISHGGLEGGNEECGAFVDELSMSDKLFLEKIKANATYIDDDEYQKHLELVEEKKKNIPEEIELEDLIIPTKEEHFFKSSLPMTRSVDDLIKGYAKLSMGFEASDDKETKDCIIHDLAIYNLEELGLPQDEFVAKLKIQFFSHPFIKKIEEFINPEAYWGRVREWVQQNCKDDPIPRRWELTENTQTLYDWLVNLGDGKYIVDVPGARSERIRRVDGTLEYENEVLQVLESPGYTIEEIKKIYEKLERGWYVHDEPSDLSEKENASKSNWHYKREADEKVAKMLSLSEEEIGERTAKGKLYKKIVSVISKLHGNGFIKMWYYESNRGTWSDGIWRLTEEGKREIQRRGLTKTNNNENPISQFKVHQFYHHEKIYQTISGIGAGGGIRPSKDFPIIVVFRRMQNEDEENVYDDNYDEKTGIFHYNARGSGGAEQLEISQNQEIVNAKENGKTIIFFNQHENKGEYEYLGEVELVGTTTEKQLDNEKYIEKLVFLLKPLD
ncbi:MAG: hypothetical protein HOF89_01625 [Candidatus Nitrosopelagicus sp.]|jgi:hypothetical protein|nr:hypothetical protein [Candidatus Nitrosopelagicus sp.]